MENKKKENECKTQSIIIEEISKDFDFYVKYMTKYKNLLEQLQLEETDVINDFCLKLLEKDYYITVEKSMKSYIKSCLFTTLKDMQKQKIREDKNIQKIKEENQHHQQGKIS